MVNAKKHVVGWLMLAGVISLPIAAQGAIVVSDDFSTQGRGVAAGDSLYGVQIQHQQGTGEKKWMSGDGGLMAFTSDGTVGVRDYSGWSAENGGAQVNIPTPTAKETVSITFTNTTAGWVGIGFQKYAALSFFKSNLFATINPAGAWCLYVNGMDGQGGAQNLNGKKADGTIKDFDGSKANTISLTYDPASQTAEFLVNGVSATGPIKVSLIHNIGSAGFSINAEPKHSAADSSQTVTNFEVTVPDAGSPDTQR